MSRLTQDSVRRVIEQIDIIDLISRYVSLKVKGTEASGLCPFHHEKSPSFTASRSKQFFYCFGCHAKGNAIDFVMQHEKFSFPEAVVYLSELYHIPVEYQSPKQSDAPSLDYEALRRLLQQSTHIFQQCLRLEPSVIDYCKQRGISGVTAKKFQLGYAPLHCLKPLIPESLSMKDASGLWSAHRERFAERLIFPILNLQGQVIGFGGRALKEGQEPKYLNSPDTPLFHKSKVLYGMPQALKQPLDYWVIVEGYMDVLRCHQEGITQAVAVLGTSFTADHFKLLTRYSMQLVFCFDGDNAGKRALHRTMEALLPWVQDPHDIRCLHLPDGLDPDEYLKKYGADSWMQLIKEATRWEQFWEQHWAEGLKLDHISDKAKLLQRAQKSFEQMPNSYLKQLWMQRLEHATHVSWLLPQKTPPRPAQPPKQHALIDCLRWLFESASYRDLFMEDFKSFPARNQLIEALCAWAQKKEPTRVSSIEDARGTFLGTYLQEAQEPELSPRIPFEDSIRWLKKNALDEAIQELLNKERSPEESSRLKHLLTLKHHLTQDASHKE